MADRLGKYDLVTLMSVGGMAELHLASMAGPGGFRKVVALKQMLPEFRDNPTFVHGFLDEARITAALSHPHLAQVFDLGEADGELFCAMEFIVGVDLFRLSRKGPLPPGFVVRVARDVALALASAHGLSDPMTGESRALIHRDITPRNVMVTFEGVVKVIDFGLARFKGRRAKTAVGKVRGTPQYMAPEQLLDEPLDARTDLYGVGVVMWELLAGRFFAEEGVQDVEARLQRGEPAPRVRTVVPEVSLELDELIAHCLETKPENRFASARELARALERCGVELFDEGRMAEFLKEQLPETRTALRRLVALAEQAEPSAESIKAELRALRKADGRSAGSAAVTAPESVESVGPAARPTARSSPGLPAQLPINRFAMGAVALVLVLIGLYWVIPREQGMRPQRAMSDEVARMWSARNALAQGDPLEARAIAVSCRGPRGPCPGVDGLLKEIDAALKLSPCGTDENAKAFVAEAKRADPSVVGARIRECVAGKRLHPLAGRALQELELVKPEPTNEEAPRTE